MGIEVHRRNGIVIDVDNISGNSLPLQIGKRRLDVVDAIRRRLLDYRKDRWKCEQKNRCKTERGKSAGNLQTQPVDGSGRPQEETRQQKQNQPVADWIEPSDGGSQGREQRGVDQQRYR